MAEPGRTEVKLGRGSGSNSGCHDVMIKMAEDRTEAVRSDDLSLILLSVQRVLSLWAPQRCAHQLPYAYFYNGKHGLVWLKKYLGLGKIFLVLCLVGFVLFWLM